MSKRLNVDYFQQKYYKLYMALPAEQNATLHFHKELNDFLPLNKRGKKFNYAFKGNPSIKNVIEAVGIPHTEVDIITASNNSVGFDYHLKQDDRINAYPVSCKPDISPVIKLRPDLPAGQRTFILDVHLGKLARILRLLGFDVYYRNNYDDFRIIQIALKTGRIIITRDRKLLHIKSVTYGYWLRSTNSLKQLLEVVQRYDLFEQIESFKRCMVCNGRIKKIDKEKILHRLQPKSAKYINEFYTCENCHNIYWQGSHCKNLNSIIRFVLEHSS